MMSAEAVAQISVYAVLFVDRLVSHEHVVRNGSGEHGADAAHPSAQGQQLRAHSHAN